MPSGKGSSPAAVTTAAEARPPVSLTRLVGRSREIEELETLLASSRLVTLTGVGGGGKSRLAAELGRRASKQQQTVWVDLASCADPQLLPQRVASAFALRGTSGRDTVGTLVDFLRERELLVVLDNCEHVIDACADLATALLSQCQQLTLLATSREPLGIAGERVWPVPPLGVPEADARDSMAIAATSAVELFVDRARAADPSFGLTDENAAAVAAICRRLDGIPLAIELAAARVRLLTPDQIASRLDDRFALLGGVARAGVARHRTLRSTIDWSFALLSEPEQKLLARLAVFAGSFSLEAVEAVHCDDAAPRGAALDLLGALVDKSLVVASRGTLPRYAMLETIASYAAERLASTDEASLLRRRHADAYLAIARDALPGMSFGSTAALERIDADRDNIRAALAWGIENEPDAIGLPLAAALRWHWYYRVQWGDGVHWLGKALDRACTALSHDRASALTGRGTLTAYLGDLPAARAMLTETERMWRTLGDERQLALNLSALAQLLATIGELDAAAPRAAEAVELARRSGIAWDIGYCLTNAAAFLAQVRGDFDEADRHLAEAEAIWSETRHPLGLPFVLNARALLALRRQDDDAAARLARSALVETRDRHELWFSSRSLRILAFTSLSDPLRAAQLLGAAACMLQTMTAGMLLHERAEHERLLAALHERLTPEELETALRDGRNMSFDDACALAMIDAPQPARVAAAGGHVIHIHDLGPLRVTLDGKPLDGVSRASARASEMLVFLASHPEGRTKEEVGVALWPDASTEQVKNSFHVTMHRLRKALGRNDAVTSDGGRYRIDPRVSHIAASREFERDVTAALRGDDPPRLQAALAAYGGDFLQGEDVGEWCLPIRAHLRQLFLRGLFALGQRLEARGRYEEAADSYRRVTVREPFHEAAWRQLMVCRARIGLRSESLLLYRDLEQKLRTELETKPEPETMSLFRRLQQNETV
jgi:predicted ATPase/DNA-binding SARP family transcriptional activator